MGLKKAVFNEMKPNRIAFVKSRKITCDEIKQATKNQYPKSTYEPYDEAESETKNIYWDCNLNHDDRTYCSRLSNFSKHQG